jgi:hypothetical protein
MSLSRVIDSFAEAAEAVEASGDGYRERAEAIVLPVWAWLSSVPALARETKIEWETVDAALGEDQEQEIANALGQLAESFGKDRDAFESALGAVRKAVVDGVEHAQAQLQEAGVEAHSIARLFWPVRSELASWRQREESDAALTQVRSALTEVSAGRLALRFDEQFAQDLRQANRYRVGAILFFIAAVGWSIAALETLPKQVTAAGIAGRGVVSLSLIVVGGFLIRESVQHRVDANVWRTVQLQLNAIESYAVGLAREDADLLKLTLGLAVFSGPRLYGMATAPIRRSNEAGVDGTDSNPGGGILELRELLGTIRELAELLRQGRGMVG